MNENELKRKERIIENSVRIACAMYSNPSLAVMDDDDLAVNALQTAYTIDNTVMQEDEDEEPEEA